MTSAHSVAVTYKKHTPSAGKWRPESIVSTLRFWVSGDREDIDTITVNGIAMSKEHWQSQLLIMGITNG